MTTKRNNLSRLKETTYMAQVLRYSLTPLWTHGYSTVSGNRSVARNSGAF